jgi:hypothetical protein
MSNTPDRKRQMNCTHKSEKKVPIYETDDWGNTYVYYETVITTFTEDIDLHRYRCTKCKGVFYYSGAAKQHFENGVIFEGITGLEGKR